MKLTREEFQKYIYSYNDDETFYKTLYLQEKEHPETFHDYCLTLDRKQIYEHRLYVPELQAEAWYPYMKETDLFHDINGNIVLFPFTGITAVIVSLILISSCFTNNVTVLQFDLRFYRFLHHWFFQLKTVSGLPCAVF